MLKQEEIADLAEGDVCSICLQPHTFSCSVRLPCKHCLHTHCLASMLKSVTPSGSNQAKCPICRANVYDGIEVLSPFHDRGTEIAAGQASAGPEDRLSLEFNGTDRAIELSEDDWTRLRLAFNENTPPNNSGVFRAAISSGRATSGVTGANRNATVRLFRLSPAGDATLGVAAASAHSVPLPRTRLDQRSDRRADQRSDQLQDHMSDHEPDPRPAQMPDQMQVQRPDQFSYQGSDNQRSVLDISDHGDEGNRPTMQNIIIPSTPLKKRKRATTATLNLSQTDQGNESRPKRKRKLK